METTKKLVEKYNIQTVNGGQNLRADDTVRSNREDMDYVRSHKSEIIEYLKLEWEKGLAAEHAENQKKYAHLIEKLPERKIENIPDEEKFQELMSKINHTYFSGPEDDGLNISVSAGNSNIRREAGKYCNHELKTDYDYTYTQDARKKIVRTISCQKCQLYIRDEASDPVSEEAMWR